MFKSIFNFELKYRLVRPATYIYFGIFFLLTFLATVTDVVKVSGGSEGIVFRNAPSTIANMLAIFSAFGMLVTSAMMSTPVYRDFEHNSHHLFFTLPISKFGYLGGRFMGSFLITVLVFTGLPLGIMVGSFIGPLMGWVDADKMGPFSFYYYLQPFFTIVVPNILFSGAIFFSLVSLSRKMVYSYMGNVILLVVYIWASSQLGNFDNRNLAALLDPFALTGMGQVTRYWTSAESNNLVIPVTGILLLNRLIWIGVSLIIIIFTYKAFRFSSFLEGVKKKTKAEKEKIIVPESIGYKATHQTFATGNYIKQMVKLAWIAFQTTVKEIPFIAIVFAGVVLLFSTTSILQGIYGTSVYPVTYALLEKTSGSFALFVVIIIIFYSGELVWQERRLKMNQIFDALPVPNWLLLGSKMVAMVFIIAFLMLIIMLSSISIQLFHGYTNIDFALYFKELFYLKLFSFTLMAVLAILIQTLVKDKMLGHFIMVIYYILNIVMDQVGLTHNLYSYNGKPGYVYSDMNGYGHMLQGVNWFNLYWGIFALLLLMKANMLWVRGTEDTFRAKVKLAKQRFRGSTRLLYLLLVICWAGTGAYIFYNTNVINHYTTDKEEEKEAVRYEKTYKKYEKSPQPKIVAAKLNVDIYPNERKVHAVGALTLKNRTNKAIDTLFINYPANLKVNALDFAGYNMKPLVNDKKLGFAMYRLSKPLQAGDSAKLNFDFLYHAQGFTNEGGRTSVVYNGTFFNNGFICPSIGYSPNGELDDKSKRKKNGLKPKDRMAPVNDSLARMSTYIGSDGDWIDFEATVSTSADQIALAPGYLQKEWTEGGRRYFHYKMDSKILNFYAFQSARYSVKRDKYKGINLEIYYHPGHEYNLDKMMKGMKNSLDYYNTNFSAYQHRQVRIVEFPRYASFAQSFPNTIPFSESIGFIANLENADDIDYVYYVTAHEVAHQWWAHQVIGGNVQGATVLSETLSQYSALMLMEKEYGKDKMQKFLKFELDNYLSGRRLEDKKEVPLMLCENQQYIHYNKGSVVMYALKDYIGEQNLNRALANFIKDKAFQQPPFTNTIEFLKYIKAETPDSLQYIIKDMFETITLYSNKADEVTYTKMPGGKFKVNITVDSHKFRADSLGKENEIDFADYIDIGVLGETKNAAGKAKDKTLYLQKYKLKKGINKFEVIVNEEPKKAGVDIYNKLIDRDSDDNTKKATLKS